MPPKKSTATATPSTRSTTAGKSTTTKAPASKRKATEDITEQPPAKRGRPPKRKATEDDEQPPAPKRGRPAKNSTAAAPSAKKAAAKATTKASSKATKQAPVKTTASKTAKAIPAANTSAKRKASDDAEPPAAKKARTATAASTSSKSRTTKSPVSRKARIPKATSAINQVSSERLDVYVVGQGDAGELGLGTAKNAKGVKRPRLNPHLSAQTVGVVHIAAGGMHAAALTHDSKILTWGVNDQGACGRDTTWAGGLRDVDDAKSDDDSDDSDDDSGLNPKEATPTAISSDAFPKDVKFVQLIAGDSTTFALTDDGYVWGWGTFRDNQGILGFTKDVEVQRSPALVAGLKNIKHLACGANHVLALDANGNVFAWGTGQQNQLGRRVVERTRLAGLTPREFGLPKKQIKYIAAGSDHSFAVDTKDNVWSWGLNNYGQCGIADNAGGEDAIVAKPQKVESLDAYTMTCLKGGRHHSVGVSEKGECLVWGRADGAQVGIKVSDLPEQDIIKDERDRPRILKNPTQIQGITAKFVTAESDHSIAVTTAGQAYSWGFSGTYQTGLGTDEDVEVATLIDNTAVRGKQINWAGAGGQYSILTAVAQAPIANGTTAGNEVKVSASNGAPKTGNTKAPAPTENETVEDKMEIDGPIEISMVTKNGEV